MLTQMNIIIKIINNNNNYLRFILLKRFFSFERCFVSQKPIIYFIFLFFVRLWHSWQSPVERAQETMDKDRDPTQTNLNLSLLSHVNYC